MSSSLRTDKAGVSWEKCVELLDENVFNKWTCWSNLLKMMNVWMKKVWTLTLGLLCSEFSLTVFGFCTVRSTNPTLQFKNIFSSNSTGV